MNERLKYAAKQFQARRNDLFISEHAEHGPWYALLAAAARGEIPGFQLVPTQPSETALIAIAKVDYETVGHFEAEWAKSYVAAFLSVCKEELS